MGGPGKISRWGRLYTIPTRLGFMASASVICTLVFILAAGLALDIPGEAQVAGYRDSSQLSTRGPRVGFTPFKDSLLALLLGLRPDGRPGDGLEAFESAGAVGRAGSGSARPAACGGFLCQANVIPGIPYQDSRDTTGASRKSGDPASCAQVGGTEWYLYTAPANEVLSSNTAGTDYPVALAVFKGSDPAHLVQLACASDVRGQADTGWFTASRGQTYAFQVTGLAHGGHLSFQLEGGGVGPVERVSVTPSGAYPDFKSAVGDVTPDGRYVAFISAASNMGWCPASAGSAPYQNQCWGVYLRDRLMGTTTTIDQVIRDNAFFPIAGTSVSADARYVAFATDYPPPGYSTAPGTEWDVYVKDRVTGAVESASVSSAGQDGHPAAGQPVCGTTFACSPQGSYAPRLSADGRYVVFTSTDANLVANGCAGVSSSGCPAQVYVRDRVAGTTRLVSLRPDGQVMNAASDAATISADGRYVAFESANNVYVRDLVAGVTTLVSAPRDGSAANGQSSNPTISADGQHVVFASTATNLVAGSSGAWDEYEWDAPSHVITLVSVTSSGAEQQQQTACAPGCPSGGISGDGRYTAFVSDAHNLGAGGSGIAQVYLHDRVSGSTLLVSATAGGAPGNEASDSPAISADGSAVIFGSAADNFDPGALCGSAADTIGRSTGSWCEGVLAREVR